MAAKEKQQPVPTVFIAVRRNVTLLTELAKKYPHVRVLSLERKDLFTTIKALRLNKVQYIITQQTFSRIVLRIKLFAWVCARYSGAQLVGYDDLASYNRFIYSRLWKFDTKVLFPLEMQRLAGRLGFDAPYVQPSLRWDVEPIRLDTHFVIHLNAFTPSRSWPAAKWQSLLKHLRELWPERTFIFTGSKADRAFIDLAIAGIPGCDNKAGLLSLTELIATLDTCALFIGVDTGITHLAAFRHVLSVIVGNNSNPCWWSTYSPKTLWLSAPEHCTCRGDKTGDCSVCIDGQKYYRCLFDIKEGQVITAVATCLK